MCRGCFNQLFLRDEFYSGGMAGLLGKAAGMPTRRAFMACSIVSASALTGVGASPVLETGKQKRRHERQLVVHESVDRRRRPGQEEEAQRPPGPSAEEDSVEPRRSSGWASKGADEQQFSGHPVRNDPGQKGYNQVCTDIRRGIAPIDCKHARSWRDRRAACDQPVASKMI